MPIWAILLIAWAIGIPVAYIVTDRLHIAWMRSFQWTEETQDDSRKACRDEILLLSLCSWLFVAASVKSYIEIRKYKRALDDIKRQLDSLSAIAEKW